MSVTYTVYYRQGGTDNFRWVRVAEQYRTVDMARAAKDVLTRMGYRAHFDRTDFIDSIGLPGTFSATSMLS
jgi:hypothetical protein